MTSHRSKTDITDAGSRWFLREVLQLDPDQIRTRRVRRRRLTPKQRQEHLAAIGEHIDTTLEDLDFSEMNAELDAAAAQIAAEMNAAIEDFVATLDIEVAAPRQIDPLDAADEHDAERRGRVSKTQRGAPRLRKSDRQQAAR